MSKVWAVLLVSGSCVVTDAAAVLENNSSVIPTTVITQAVGRNSDSVLRPTRAEKITRCGALPNVKLCSFYNKDGSEGETHIYTKPNKNSPIVYSEHVDFVVNVNTKVAKPYPDGWLPVVGVVPPKGDAQFVYRGWLSLDAVVDELSLKRVVGCWPYSKVEAEIGEVMSAYSFDVDGSYLDDSEPKSKLKNRLFYGGGIVLFKKGPKPFGDYVYFNPSTQAVTKFDGYGEVITASRFPSSKLQGCGSEPTVTENPLTKAKSSKH